MDVTLITPCMGRLEHIKRTIPENQKHGFKQIVVDYSDPDHCGDWLEQNHPAVGVVRLPGQAYFNHAAARNAGAAAVTTKWIGFLDADLFLLPEFKMPELLEKQYALCVKQSHGYAGFIVCLKSAFDAVGGYDVECEGWGYEDTYFKRKLRFDGLIPKFLPETWFKHIDHGNDMRVKFFEEKKIVYSHERNRRLMERKHRAKGSGASGTT